MDTTSSSSTVTGSSVDIPDISHDIIDIDIVRANPQYAWDRSLLSKNRNITYTDVKFLQLPNSVQYWNYLHLAHTFPLGDLAERVSAVDIIDFYLHPAPIYLSAEEFLAYYGHMFDSDEVFAKYVKTLVFDPPVRIQLAMKYPAIFGETYTEEDLEKATNWEPHYWRKRKTVPIDIARAKKYPRISFVEGFSSYDRTHR